MWMNIKILTSNCNYNEERMKIYSISTRCYMLLGPLCLKNIHTSGKMLKIVGQILSLLC
ncbi:hypothetical protein Hanom_Chr11g01043921 [Helianthus anomalus]